jgi:O-antigen ligase
MNPRILVVVAALALALGALLTADVHLSPALVGSVGATALFVLVTVGLFRPEVPLYALAVYLPFSHLLPGGFGGFMAALNATNLLFGVVLVTWFFACISRGEPFLEFHPLHLPVVVLAAWVCVSYLLTALDPAAPEGYASEHLDELKRWLDPFVVYFLVFLGSRRASVWKNLVGVVMAVVAVVAALAEYDYIGVADSSLERSRVGGVVGQPNLLGAFFTYYMFLYAGHWLENLRRRRAWLFLALFALAFRGIMVTFSRGAYLAFGLGVLGMAFFKKRRLAVLAVAAIAFAALNPWVLPAGMRQRLGATFRSQPTLLTDDSPAALQNELDTSAATRIVIWNAALQMITDHPVFGVGFGRFQEVVVQYADLGSAKDAHNAYLITAAEMGLPALVLLLLSIATLFWVGRRVCRRSTDPFMRATALGFLGGLSALLMANMFGSRLNSTEVTSYLWLLAALMARADLRLADLEDADLPASTEAGTAV